MITDTQEKAIECNRKRINLKLQELNENKELSEKCDYMIKNIWSIIDHIVDKCPVDQKQTQAVQIATKKNLRSDLSAQIFQQIFNIMEYNKKSYMNNINLMRNSIDQKTQQIEELKKPMDLEGLNNNLKNYKNKYDEKFIALKEKCNALNREIQNTDFSISKIEEKINLINKNINENINKIEEKIKPINKNINFYQQIFPSITDEHNNSLDQNSCYTQALIGLETNEKNEKNEKIHSIKENSIKNIDSNFKFDKYDDCPYKQRDYKKLYMEYKDQSVEALKKIWQKLEDEIIQNKANQETFYNMYKKEINQDEEDTNQDKEINQDEETNQDKDANKLIKQKNINESKKAPVDKEKETILLTNEEMEVIWREQKILTNLIEMKNLENEKLELEEERDELENKKNKQLELQKELEAQKDKNLIDSSDNSNNENITFNEFEAFQTQTQNTLENYKKLLIKKLESPPISLCDIEGPIKKSYQENNLNKPLSFEENKKNLLLVEQDSQSKDQNLQSKDQNLQSKDQNNKSKETGIQTLTSEEMLTEILEEIKKKPEYYKNIYEGKSDVQDLNKDNLRGALKETAEMSQNFLKIKKNLYDLKKIENELYGCLINNDILLNGGKESKKIDVCEKTSIDKNIKDFIAKIKTNKEQQKNLIETAKEKNTQKIDNSLNQIKKEQEFIDRLKNFENLSNNLKPKIKENVKNLTLFALYNLETMQNNNLELENQKYDIFLDELLLDSIFLNESNTYHLLENKITNLIDLNSAHIKEKDAMKRIFDKAYKNNELLNKDVDDLENLEEKYKFMLNMKLDFKEQGRSLSLDAYKQAKKEVEEYLENFTTIQKERIDTYAKKDIKIEEYTKLLAVKQDIINELNEIVKKVCKKEAVDPNLVDPAKYIEEINLMKQQIKEKDLKINDLSSNKSQLDEALKTRKKDYDLLLEKFDIFKNSIDNKEILNIFELKTKNEKYEQEKNNLEKERKSLEKKKNDIDLQNKYLTDWVERRKHLERTIRECQGFLNSIKSLNANSEASQKAISDFSKYITDLYTKDIEKLEKDANSQEFHNQKSVELQEKIKKLEKDNESQKEETKRNLMLMRVFQENTSKLNKLDLETKEQKEVIKKINIELFNKKDDCAILLEQNNLLQKQINENTQEVEQKVNDLELQKKINKLENSYAKIYEEKIELLESNNYKDSEIVKLLKEYKDLNLDADLTKDKQLIPQHFEKLEKLELIINKQKTNIENLQVNIHELVNEDNLDENQNIIINRYKNQNNLLNTETIKLKFSIEDLEIKLEENTQENNHEQKNLKEQINNLQKAVRDLQNSNGNLINKNKIIEEKNALIEENNTQNMNLYQMASQEIIQIKIISKNQKKEIFKLGEEILYSKQLYTYLQEVCQLTNKENQKYRAQNLTLLSKNKDLENEANQLKIQMGLSEDEYSKNLMEKKNELISINRNLEAIKVFNIDLENKGEEWLKKNLENSIIIQQLTKENETLKTEDSELKQKIEDLEKKNLSLNDKNTLLELANKTLDEEKKTIKKKQSSY
jgi:hypothetical protein